MADRTNHYEAAFEGYLRSQRRPYVAVDEARRSAWPLPAADHASPSCCESAFPSPGEFASPPVDSDHAAGDRSLKNPDFIVPSSHGLHWLVDVKGRRFPSGRQRQYWKNWSTRDDLFSLARWEALLGHGFQGLLVFAYLIAGDRSPLPAEQLFEFRGRHYGFVAIRLLHYAAHSYRLSPRWGTVAMSSGGFRRLAQPLAELL